MLPSVRREQIFQIVLREHTVTIEDLARRFEVSDMTIRRDLQILEKEGLVEAVHGGVMATASNPFELSFAQREMVNRAEKRAIGHAAAQLVQEGDIIALDGSTTTMQVARNLANRSSLTVFTNGIKTAAELGHRPGIRVILTGGELYQTVSLVGPFARTTIERIRVDKLFLSVTGITFDMGLSGPSDLDAEIKAAMVGIAKEVIVVADASKFGRKSYVQVAPLERVNTVVSDTGLPDEIGTRFHSMGIGVVLVPVTEMTRQQKNKSRT